MKSITVRGALAACATLTVAAAAAPAAHAKAKPRQATTIDFAAVAGTTPVACGTPIEGLGTTSQAAQLTDLRFYVSNVRLVRADGGAVPVKLKKNRFQVTEGKGAVTLIDLEDASGACADGTPERNAAVRGTVPKGSYVGAKWSVGVPFALNHTDTVGAAAPLNSTAMGWSWQFGRKFAKIELADPMATGGMDGGHGGTRQHGEAPMGSWSFLVHLGSTGCEGNPATGEAVKCKAGNRSSVTLPEFDPRTQVAALDVQKLVAGNDITVNKAGAPGCMSGPTDPECAGVFSAFGVDWKADGSGTGASKSGLTQTLFRAIEK